MFTILIPAFFFPLIMKKINNIKRGKGIMKVYQASHPLKANINIKAVHISKPFFLYDTWQLSPSPLEALPRIIASGFHS